MTPSQQGDLWQLCRRFGLSSVGRLVPLLGAEIAAHARRLACRQIQNFGQRDVITSGYKSVSLKAVEERP
jgi:hypothetical protein